MHSELPESLVSYLTFYTSYMIALILFYIGVDRSVETVVLRRGPGSVRKFDLLMNGQLPECYISLVFIINASIGYKKHLLSSSGWKAVVLFSGKLCEHLALLCFKMRSIL